MAAHALEERNDLGYALRRADARERCGCELQRGARIAHEHPALGDARVDVEDVLLRSDVLKVDLRFLESRDRRFAAPGAKRDPPEEREAGTEKVAIVERAPRRKRLVE